MTTFEVDRIAENTRHDEGVHQVQVTLALVKYREFVGDLLRRLTSLGYLEQFPMLHATETQDSLHYFMALLPPAPSWLLGTEEAAALALALTEACEEPASCACGRFIEEPSGLTILTGCATCHERNDRA